MRINILQRTLGTHRDQHQTQEECPDRQNHKPLTKFNAHKNLRGLVYLFLVLTLSALPMLAQDYGVICGCHPSFRPGYAGNLMVDAKPFKPVIKPGLMRRILSGSWLKRMVGK